MKGFLKILGIYFLLSYGLFYYAYKFSSPQIQGLKDYKEYEKLYKNWDYENVTSPFNSRIISTYGVYLLNKLNISYETNIGFTKDETEKQIFFNALLFNYLFILLTAVLIFYYAWYQGIDRFQAFLGGLLYIFSFSTIFFYLNPLTEGLSCFLTALIFLSVLKRNYWFVLLFILVIFQREYIFFIFGLFALLNFFFNPNEKKYWTIVLLSSIVGFVIYFVLRKTLFFTPHHAEQTNFNMLFNDIFSIHTTFSDYVKQSFLTLNLFIAYLGLVFYKSIKGISIDKKKLLMIVGFFVQMIIISFIAKLAQTIGRLFFLTAPLIIYYLLFELNPLINMVEKGKKS